MKLNGNLELNTLGLSEIKNAVIERIATLDAPKLSEKGRIVFNMTDKLYYYNNGTSITASGWSVLATGAQLTAAADELNAVETALGVMIDGTTGNFDASAFSAFSKVGVTGGYAAPTSVLDALSQLDASISGKDQFAELVDVTITAPIAKQVPYYDAIASEWVNHTLVLTDISDITATAADLNNIASAGVTLADLTKLHAITASAAQINYLDNVDLVAADIQKLADLTATATEINQLAGSGVVQADLIKLHALTSSAVELNYVTGVTSSIQDQLNNKQPLDADLTTIAAFAPIADSSETLTINGTSYTHAGQNDIMVATGGVEGARWALKRGADARTSLGLGNIAVMDEAAFIRGNGTSSNVAQDVSWSNYKISNLAAGTSTTDAVNLGQLQAMQAGLAWKDEALAATTANVTLAGEQVVDGYSLVAGDIVLVKNQTLPAENGLYAVSADVWVRTVDADTATELNKATVFVKFGTAQGITQWTVNSNVEVLGTDAVTWVQTNALSGVTAGVGLTKVGNTLDVNLGAGIVELTSDQIGLDLYDPLTSAIVLTTTGADRSDATNARLHLLLDLTANGKLVQAASGLKVTTNTITEAELTASVAGDGLTGGNGTALTVVSAAGTAATGGDDTANWAGVGAVTITADAVGVTLGSTSTTAAPGNHVHKADVITFDNTATSLAGAPATVQAAIVAIDTTLDDVFADLGQVKTAAGFDATTGAFVAHTTATLATVNSATTVFGVDEALSKAITDLDTQINTKLGKSYYQYTSTAASSTHVVPHAIGSKYCLVTVIDITTGSATIDQVVIPESITFNSTTQLTVTFNESIDCVIMVTSIAV